MNWNPLTRLDQLNELITTSASRPVLIFKHSTRCGISSMVLARLERKWREGCGIQPIFLDLIAYREVSNAIQDRFGVRHESPQAILIKDGEVVYHASHGEIDFEDMCEIGSGLETV